MEALISRQALPERIAEFETKLVRLRGWLDEQGYTGIALGRRDSFAWLTGGGDSKVLRNSDEGFGILTVTPSAVFLTAHTMDLARIRDEELAGLPVECIPVRWDETSRMERALALAGECQASDLPFPGVDCRFRAIWDLQFPLLPQEQERYREAGRTVDRLLTEVACAVHPGMTERQTEAEILHAYDTLNHALALTCARSRGGVSFRKMFEERKQLLTKAGYPDDWALHFPGALSGYPLGSAEPFLDDTFCYRDGMVFDYYITLTGAKVEEQVISGPDGGEAISVGGHWPVERVGWNGFSINLPVLWCR